MDKPNYFAESSAQPALQTQWKHLTGGFWPYCRSIATKLPFKGIKYSLELKMSRVENTAHPVSLQEDPHFCIFLFDVRSSVVLLHQVLNETISDTFNMNYVRIVYYPIISHIFKVVYPRISSHFAHVSPKSLYPGVSVGRTVNETRDSLKWISMVPS